MKCAFVYLGFRSVWSEFLSGFASTISVDGLFFRRTESTDVPQFEEHRFRLISGLSLIGSMMDQSATVKSTRSDQAKYVKSPAGRFSCRM